MRSENRHYTIVWKKRREKKYKSRCGNPKCGICHSDKVLRIPTPQEMKQGPKAANVAEGMLEYEDLTDEWDCPLFHPEIAWMESDDPKDWLKSA